MAKKKTAPKRSPKPPVPRMTRKTTPNRVRAARRIEERENAFFRRLFKGLGLAK